MQVLVGTDGSNQAITAATRALTVLAPPDLVTLVCVSEHPPIETSGYESGFAGGMASPEDVEAARVAATDEAKDAVERTVALLPRSVPTERTTAFGDAGPRICQLAREIPADVVVVGSRGRGAMRRALFGSVSTHVVQHAPCPVLVVGAGD